LGVLINYTTLIKTCCFSVLLLFLVNAQANMVISITDQNGAPLKDAILEIQSIDKASGSENTNNVYVMDQVNKTFSPHVLAIPQNSRVSFPNSDNIRHHVYSFSKVKPFELKLYAGKPEAPVTFDKSGVAVLGCNIHDSMVGYIYIHENNTVYKSNDKGQITLDYPLNNIEKIWLWHARNTTGINFKKALIVRDFIQQKNSLAISIEVLPPEPRDSFEDVFTHVH